MNPARDNPITRVAAFWWGILLFLGFSLLLGVIVLWKSSSPESLEDVAAKGRYEKKSIVAKAQAEELSLEKIKAAIPGVAEKLAASKPVAVEKPEQIVPGSATSEKLKDTPSVPVIAEKKEETPVSPAVFDAMMETGKSQFMICSACHGQNAEGGPVAPPLAGSEWVNGPVSNLIRIQFRGLNGPIIVKGKERSFPVGMAALTYQTDEQIAAVLTYVRNSFGNKASAVTPEEVKALRGEVGKPPLTVKDLEKPLDR